MQRSQLTHGALTRSSICAVCQALALLTALRASHFTDSETEALSSFTGFHNWLLCLLTVVLFNKTPASRAGIPRRTQNPAVSQKANKLRKRRLLGSGRLPENQEQQCLV